MFDVKCFKGQSYSSLQGTIKNIDLDAPLPRFELISRAGNHTIKCVGKLDLYDAIKANKDTLVSITGLFHYDGRQVWPSWIEAIEIEPVAPAGDFSLWKGSFEPSYELAPWEV